MQFNRTIIYMINKLEEWQVKQIKNLSDFVRVKNFRLSSKVHPIFKV